MQTSRHAKHEWSDDFAKTHKTKRSKLLNLLWDLDWHHHTELSVAGVRYSARLLELKRLGYTIETKPNLHTHGNYYRLVSHEQSLPQERQVKVFLDPSDVAYLLDWKSSHLRPTARKQLSDALARYKANITKL